MKIFTGKQIREIDEYTILHEPVSSVDLMERAATQLYNWIISRFERSARFIVFTGPGNNGGDGLALARILYLNRYNVSVYNIVLSDRHSHDWELNFRRLTSETGVRITHIHSNEEFPVISPGDVIIDSIFGTGLTRPVDGLAGEVIREINKQDCTRIAVDIPSGLFGEDNSTNNYENIVQAAFTLSFQFPKLAFMFPENHLFTGEWFTPDIGLSREYILNCTTPYIFTCLGDSAVRLKTRSKFDHKGVFGHGLLVAGSSGRIGAAILGAEAALRSGIGLLTCHIPRCGTTAMHSALPEAMVSEDSAQGFISGDIQTGRYNAVGVGPGIGTLPETQAAIHKLLTTSNRPMVIDADALNILSMNKEWLSLIPPDSILTPHPREFERMAGISENGYARLMNQIRFSRDHNCTVVLKGAFTSVTTRSGQVFFNSTGNPGMATAGSGDVLTGIILSLLAQGLTGEDAAVTGVFLHGLAGDIAARKGCFESLIASDITKYLPEAFIKIRENLT